MPRPEGIENWKCILCRKPLGVSGSYEFCMDCQDFLGGRKRDKKGVQTLEQMNANQKDILKSIPPKKETQEIKKPLPPLLNFTIATPPSSPKESEPKKEIPKKKTGLGKFF